MTEDMNLYSEAVQRERTQAEILFSGPKGLPPCSCDIEIKGDPIPIDPVLECKLRREFPLQNLVRIRCWRIELGWNHERTRPFAGRCVFCVYLE